MTESDRIVNRVRALSERGEPLLAEDARGLLDIRDLTMLGRLASPARERRYGRDAFFCVAEPMRLSNEEPEAFARRIEEHVPEGTVEISVSAKLDRSRLDELATIASIDRRIVMRFEADDIVAATDGSVEQIATLLEAVESSMPFEIAVERQTQYDPVYDNAEPDGDWRQVHRAAHRLGLETDAVVGLQTDADPDRVIARCEEIREMNRDESTEGRFRRVLVVPRDDRSRTAAHESTPTAASIVRTAATVRLFLENVDHVVLPWRLLDPDLATIALSYGVDTIDPVPSLDVPVTPGPEGGLPVVAPNTSSGVDLGAIEGRIDEARYRPVPVDRFGIPFDLVGEPKGA